MLQIPALFRFANLHSYRAFLLQEGIRIAIFPSQFGVNPQVSFGDRNRGFLPPLTATDSKLIVVLAPYPNQFAVAGA
jgi:hypothetical protein